MFRIGEFSRMSRTPVTTLRYYDEMGLLKPLTVDEFTGYRYYTLDQLPRLNRILALRDLGLSLEQIAQLLKETLTPAQVQKMLDSKEVELCQKIQDEQERLARVRARIRQIEQEGMMSNYDVIVKPVEAVRVASIREVMPKYSDIGQRFGELAAYLGQHHTEMVGPGIAVWYDPEFREQDVDGEAAIPIQGPLQTNERVKVSELPAVETMACGLHKGPFDLLPQAYTAIIEWVHANGYSIIGPIREVYLQMDMNGSPDDYLTEVQIPIAKK